MSVTASPSPRMRSSARLIERAAMLASLAIAGLVAWQAVVFLRVLRAPALPAPAAAAVPQATASIEALFGTADAALETLPPILLQASFVHSDPGLSTAILAAGDGPGRRVGVGEDVLPGVQLAAVAPDHVVLAKGGARLSLALRPAASQ